jgi:hypothetical protein
MSPRSARFLTGGALRDHVFPFSRARFDGVEGRNGKTATPLGTKPSCRLQKASFPVILSEVEGPFPV